MNNHTETTELPVPAHAPEVPATVPELPIQEPHPDIIPRHDPSPDKSPVEIPVEKPGRGSKTNYTSNFGMSAIGAHLTERVISGDHKLQSFNS